MLYAKSDKLKTINEHSTDLLHQLDLLRNIYGNIILENKDIEEQRFWLLLKLACEYHDIGKVYTPFQNLILKKLGKSLLNTQLPQNIGNDVKHEELSPMFIPFDLWNLTQEEKKVLIQAIFFHHNRDRQMYNKEIIQEIINKDIMPRIELLQQEIDVPIKDKLSDFYLTYVSNKARIKETNSTYTYYCLIKGLLNRLDYSASAETMIEDDTKEIVSEYVVNFLQNKKMSNLNSLQKFCENNKDKNVVVVGSTGMGKTEAALLWADTYKTFFTLPVRISINSMYDRILDSNGIGYKNVGLLHSTAIDYLMNNYKDEEENVFQLYKQTKLLYNKITVSTVDQIFPFVFKYKGYERIYSTLSYSKIIIDEIQAYQPKLVAAILRGLKMINDIGGKFLVMTATLPRIYKEYLEKLNIDFIYDEFINDNIKRHKITLKDTDILKSIEDVKIKAKNSSVLIIANTVEKAIKIFDECQNKNIANVNLLHARFNQKDRRQKEENIKEFNLKKEKGIWITTQLVEASLDIDFDYLYTEMSTLDSLFQRMGRCYRNRHYSNEESNICIFTRDTSGIGSIYDKEIYNKSIELLSVYDNMFLNEKIKVELVDKLYSEEMLNGTKFMKEFEQAKYELDNIIDYEVTKEQAQRIFRNIDSINVIPRQCYDQKRNLFKEYKELLSKRKYAEAYKKKVDINDYTITVMKSFLKQRYSIIDEIEDIYVVDLKYSSQKGLLFDKGDEDRFL